MFFSVLLLHSLLQVWAPALCISQSAPKTLLKSNPSFPFSLLVVHCRGIHRFRKITSFEPVAEKAEVQHYFFFKLKQCRLTNVSTPASYWLITNCSDMWGDERRRLTVALRAGVCVTHPAISNESGTTAAALNKTVLHVACASHFTEPKKTL